MNPIVVVENIFPPLRNAYGPRMHVGLDRALLGQAKGKWKIVDPVMGLGIGRPRVAVQMMCGDQRTSLRHTKVGWVQDNPLNYHGGAEYSGRRVIEVGVLCGFDVVPLVSGSSDFSKLAEMDVVVLNNLYRFTKPELDGLLKFLRERRVPYVKYEHDHREIKRKAISAPLFAGAALNVFLSPFHLKNHAEGLGAKGVALPLAIDTTKYHPVDGIERKKNRALMVGKYGHRAMAYVDAHPEIEFHVIGARKHPPGRRNLRLLPKFPADKMAEMYSGYEYLVHLPDQWCAGERVVMEAALCGCKIVMNDNVGHASWRLDLTDTPALREWLEDAPYQFWMEVDKILSEGKR